MPFKVQPDSSHIDTKHSRENGGLFVVQSSGKAAKIIIKPTENEGIMKPLN